jgi:hypothetical protein
MPRPIDVFYVGGAPRSGTTLVDLLLGTLPGVFSGGELMFVWERGVRDNQLCGCGSHFHDCPFWVDVGRHAFGGWETLDLDEILWLRRRLDRHSNFLALHVGGIRPQARHALNRFTAILAQLYSSIQAVSSCEIIVDSSKRPAYAQILRRVSSVRLHVVHCVRDPRGASFSHFRRVPRPEITERVELMPRYGAFMASVLWVASNMFIQLVHAPRTRLRYEEFVKWPARALGRVLTELPSGNCEMAPFVDSEREVFLPPNHTVAGNPVRLARGPLRVRDDDEWRSRLGRKEELIILTLTWPLMLGYGYRPLPISRIRR